MPGAQLARRRVEDPLADGHDEPGLLGERAGSRPAGWCPSADGASAAAPPRRRSSPEPRSMMGWYSRPNSFRSTARSSSSARSIVGRCVRGRSGMERTVAPRWPHGPPDGGAPQHRGHQYHDRIEPRPSRSSGCGHDNLACHNPTQTWRAAAAPCGRRPRCRADRRKPRAHSIEVNVSVETSTWATKKGLAQMLKGGVIMDVVTPDQATHRRGRGRRRGHGARARTRRHPRRPAGWRA